MCFSVIIDGRRHEGDDIEGSVALLLGEDINSGAHGNSVEDDTLGTRV